MIKEGVFNGDAVPKLQNRVYKYRVKNSDLNKGKRGGYRLIYYVLGETKEVYLISIYAKPVQENMDEGQIRRVMKELGL